MKLGVNVDHIATLRQARGVDWPDPVEAARVCEKAGAHSIVMHLREDRRHIQDSDLFRVRRAISVKLNLEMSIAPSIVEVAARLLPDQVTLVPEKRRERTTEGGLGLYNKRKALRDSVELFKKKGIAVSFFIDPVPGHIKEAVRLGADAVEFHTGDYASQRSPAGIRGRLERLKESVLLAREKGLVAHAGHGLDYRNVRRIARIQGIEELNIGYSIVTRALWVGLDAAVREMLRLIQRENDPTTCL